MNFLYRNHSNISVVNRGVNGMTYYLADSWQIGISSGETFYGDRYGAVRNDTFQLGGSAFGGLGGVQNGWERFMAVKGRIEFMSLQRRATRGPPS